MAFLFKKKRNTPIDVFREGLSTDEEVLSYHEELFRLAEDARAKLEPFGTGEYVSWDQPNLNAAGSLEGVGVLYVISHLEIFKQNYDNEDGIEKKRSARIRECEILLDNQLSWLSTAAVVCTVNLSISIALLVHVLTVFEATSQSLGGDGDERSGGFYAGWRNNYNLLHAFHWLECIFLTLSLMSSVQSIMSAFNMYDGLSTICLDIVMKLDLLVHFESELTNIYTHTTLSTFSLVFAMPFMTGRVSPVACLCTGIGTIILLIRFFMSFSPGVDWLGRKLHQKIRRKFI